MQFATRTAAQTAAGWEGAASGAATVRRISSATLQARHIYLVLGPGELRSPCSHFATADGWLGLAHARLRRMGLPAAALAAITAMILMGAMAACGGGDAGISGDAGIDEGLEVSELQCGPADAFVRLSDGTVGCTEVSDTYVEQVCGAGLRVVFDFANLDAEPGTNFTVSCTSLGDSAEDFFGPLAGE